MRFFLFTFFILNTAILAAQDSTTLLRFEAADSLDSEVHSVYQLSGMILDASTNGPVPYTNILDLSSGRGVTTDGSGFFSFVVQALDSLQITSVGYKSQGLTVPKTLTGYLQSIAIFLVSDTIELDPADVFPWPDQNSFRDAFMELQVSGPEDAISPTAGFKRVDNPVEPKATIMSPASFIYEKIVQPIKRNKRKRKKSKQLPKMPGG
jgi:hypothetical protein